MYNIEEITLDLESEYGPNDLDTATYMANLMKFTNSFFFDSGIPYHYKYSTLENTPFNKFSQKVKNRIYKIFIDEITLKGYISLKCLELFQDNFDFSYTLYGPTNTEHSNYHKKEFLISDAPSFYRVETSNLNTYFKAITSREYQLLLTRNLPKYVDEYNSTYNKKHLYEPKKIDPLFKFLDLSDDKQVINFLYMFPELYDYLKEYHPKHDLEFWLQFFKSYMCTKVAKRYQEKVNLIIQKIIEANFSNNEELFYLLIKTKSSSHMSIYFSKSLKRQLRQDFNLCLRCYENCCTKHRKEVKRMFGPKITQATKFKYLFGAK